MDYRSRMGVLATIAITLSFFHITVNAQQTVLTLDYCSHTNLGDDKTYDQWMTNGQCETNCGGQYALTIVQGNYCWCTDDAPGDTVPISECDVDCPGYPDEGCGDAAEGLFGYRQLAPPSATIGGSTPTPKSSTSSTPLSISTTSDPTTVVVTTTEEPTSTTPTSSSTSPEDSPTPKPKPKPQSTSSSSSSSSVESTTTKMTSTKVETMAGGDVTTYTVVSTSVISGPSEQSDSAVSSSSGPSAGTIAGAVVGGLAGMALIIGLAVWALLHFRRKQQSEYAGSEGGRESGVTRNTSVLSKTGLLGSGKSGSGEKPYLPPIHTTGRRSNNAFDMESASPSSDRRHSRPIFYDQRLNPSALMDNDNGSRASISTMQDNRDYTRTLNVRNPDPDTESIVEPDHNQQAQTR